MYVFLGNNSYGVDFSGFVKNLLLLIILLKLMSYYVSVTYTVNFCKHKTVLKYI